MTTTKSYMTPRKSHMNLVWLQRNHIWSLYDYQESYNYFSYIFNQLCLLKISFGKDSLLWFPGITLWSANRPKRTIPFAKLGTQLPQRKFMYHHQQSSLLQQQLEELWVWVWIWDIGSKLYSVTGVRSHYKHRGGFLLALPDCDYLSLITSG